jgi:NtrC-family two-component system response regulator AlgB
MNWSVLIVDDDSGIRQSIRLCLEPEGARIGSWHVFGGTLDRFRIWIGRTA